jgi:enediyne biosynthesis protein E4
MRKTKFQGWLICSLITLLGVFSGCVQKESNYVFEILDTVTTGIDFSNDLEMTPEMNIFKYMYFYNGAGVGLGDFNNDGLIDIFLVGNMVPDRLYLNKGDFKFEDITQLAGIEHQPEQWSTGISVVDINQDGLLDLYISQVGDFRNFTGHNKLYICEGIDENGIPAYREASDEYGLDLVGFGTQALFFDFDLDGDLDFMQMNHSLHGLGTFGQRHIFKDSLHPKAGDRFFRNDNDQFTEITREVGIHYNALGYGLGIIAADINMNGFPDVYVGNDFHENDYLYINQKDGTFREQLTEQIRYTSRFSMGVDIADVNNDGLPDIFTLDMLPYDPEILKKSEGEDALATFNFKLGYGYNHQYAKNCLQINNGNGTFSEIAQYSGVFASDWSWATLLFDFNNNGYKDIFVTNGIPKRMNDIDYINFVSDDDMSWKIRNTELDYEDLELVNSIPEIKLPNKLYRNNGNLTFTDQEPFIRNNTITYSNGAAYADLNNDGKLDMVVNNINGPALIYKNIDPAASPASLLALHLEGKSGNRQAIGSKLIAYKKNGEKLLFEKSPVRGFQSSMETPLYAGLGDLQTIDSLILIWPGGEYQLLDISALKMNGNVDTITYALIGKYFDYQSITSDNRPYKTLSDITNSLNIDFIHQENPFVEFNRERLIPHCTSMDGPALAVGDLNMDGLDDFFIGASKREIAALYFQNPNGTFSRQLIPALEADSVYEDVEALIIDVNGDGYPDLVVGSGGNEFFNNDPFQRSRVYLNDGKGNLMRLDGAMDEVYATCGTMVTSDFNGDGFPDLFIGARAESWAYGNIPRSHLLVNDGAGNFKDITDTWHKDLSHIGMVKSAIWKDIDNDGQEDLIVAVEWDGIYVFYHKGDHFEKQKLINEKGWWNNIELTEFGGDDDLILFVGNLGLNSRLKASVKEPVRMYYNDFDDNDSKEQILTYYLDGREIAFHNMADMFSQLPHLKKKFLYARDFAKASLEDLFTKEKLKSADLFEANYFENSLVKVSNNTAHTMPLPGRGQWSTLKTAAPILLDHSGQKALLMYGNYYGNNVQLGRYDADFGTLLIQNPDGSYRTEPVKGTPIPGEVRRMLPISIKGRENAQTFILARNDDKVVVISVE